jgi:type IV secretory pathway VirB6-like protein
MLVDFISGIITRPVKYRIQVEANKNTHFKKYNKDDSHFSEIQSFLYVPELVKAIEMRRGRARIARSTTINLLVATIIAALYFWQNYNLSLLIISIVIGILMTFIGFAMWSRTQRLSEGFEVESMKALDEKLKKESHSSLR